MGIGEDGFYENKIWQKLVIPQEADQNIIWTLNNKRQEHICPATSPIPLLII